EPSVEVLDLHRSNTDERLHERRRVDEHVWLAGLAGRRFGHQRLARSRRPPQQDAARHVTAAVLDLLRLLEEVQVLLDAPDDVVLSPDAAEPRLDLAGVERLDAADEEDAGAEHGEDQPARSA